MRLGWMMVTMLAMGCVDDRSRDIGPDSDSVRDEGSDAGFDTDLDADWGSDTDLDSDWDSDTETDTELDSDTDQTTPRPACSTVVVGAMDIASGSLTETAQGRIVLPASMVALQVVFGDVIGSQCDDVLLTVAGPLELAGPRDPSRVLVFPGPVIGDVHASAASVVIRGPANVQTGQEAVGVVRVGDVTDDGLNDIVLEYKNRSRPYSRTYIHRSPLSGERTGENAFRIVDTISSMGAPRFSNLIDLDGDGAVDIVHGRYFLPGPIQRCGGSCDDDWLGVWSDETRPATIDVADTMGDGEPELLLGGQIYDATVDNYLQRATAALLTSTTLLDGQLSGTTLGSLSLGPAIHFPLLTEFVGDFDGDGLADYLATEASPQSTRLYLGTPDSGFETPYRTWTGYRYDNRPRAVGDVNGDGFDDILFMLMDPARVSLVLGGVRTEPQTSVYGSDADWTRDAETFALPWLTWPDHIASGDLNGDGLSDFAVIAPEDRGDLSDPDNEYVALPIHYGGPSGPADP